MTNICNETWYKEMTSFYANSTPCQGAGKRGSSTFNICYRGEQVFLILSVMSPLVPCGG